MEIKRETIVSALTTDGRVMKSGQEYVFNTTAGCFVGEYMGMSRRGALLFRGIIGEVPVRFNIMPKSVKEIYRSFTEVQINNGEEVKETDESL